MKRTNLIVDEKLLAEAKRLLGADTQSEAVNLASRKPSRCRKFAASWTSSHWSVGGDLSTMREDKRKSKRA